MRNLANISGLFNKQQKINYEVWGSDTFSHEYYFCGIYTTRSDAEKQLEEKQKAVIKTQDESLRDEYWIVEITDKKIIERQKKNQQIRNEKNEELSYNKTHLYDCVRKLLKLFKSSWETINLEELCREKNRHIKQEVDWNNKKDCFTQVHLDTNYRDDRKLSVGIGVVVRSGKYFGGSTTLMSFFSGTLTELLQWADIEKSLYDCVIKIDELIDEFNDD